MPEKLKVFLQSLSPKEAMEFTIWVRNDRSNRVDDMIHAAQKMIDDWFVDSIFDTSDPTSIHE